MTPELLARVDAYVAQTTPVLTVPKAAPLDKLAIPGHRYLVAEGGMYVEYMRPWCRGVMRTAESTLSLPFGAVKPCFELLCGPLPRHLVAKFLLVAREHFPVEVAAWITWDATRAGTDEAWDLRILNERSAGTAHVHFERPLLPPDVHLVIDLHSHGRHGAGFSLEDDDDDRKASEVKLAGVFGNVDRDQPTVARRLCVLGTFHPFGESL
jgi:PRTRC genetic system protein A